MEFGTGAVKVTPSHDPNDYSCGKRNGLEFIVMLSGNGQINENGGKFKGKFKAFVVFRGIDIIRLFSIRNDEIRRPCRR